MFLLTQFLLPIIQIFIHKYISSLATKFSAGRKFWKCSLDTFIWQREKPILSLLYVLILVNIIMYWGKMKKIYNCRKTITSTNNLHGICLVTNARELVCNKYGTAKSMLEHCMFKILPTREDLISHGEEEKK